jgi:ABC-type uncharacterized transport system fused permease/ATPase subunit
VVRLALSPHPPTPSPLSIHHTPLQVLDESTSALSLDGEESIYRALTGICECVISVSHRPSLIKYHQSHLELNGSGGWTLKDVGVKDSVEGGGACI